MYYYQYETPAGLLYLVSDDDYLLLISDQKPNDGEFFESEIIKETYRQLDEYFKNERQSFVLPLKKVGSPFEQLVYKNMAAVAYGATVSYKGLAEQSGSPRAYRAVGSVCAKNPYPIVVPCHRILKSDNGLGGYGLGLDMKVLLLELEGKTIENGYVL